MDKLVDTFVVYHLMKRIMTPFEKTKAFALGIIDKDGNVLKKRRDLKTPEEKAAWGFTDIAVNNLKRILGVVPGGKTLVAGAAAAAFLMRESALPINVEDENVVRAHFLNFLNNHSVYHELADLIMEEVATNNVGGGKIAGAGVGPSGEPPAKRSTLVSRLNRRKKGIRNAHGNLGS